MLGYIYCYTNKINGKKYVGQTVKTITERAGKNGINYKTEWLFWRAIQKYGWSTFSVEVLETVEARSVKDLKKRLNLLEKYWIKFYHTYINDPECHGYNADLGGSACPVSEETRRKISASLKGKTPWNKGLTKETDERIKNAKPSSTTWKKGHLNSPEAMQRAHEASRGENSKVAKKVVCIETGEVFVSGAAAARKYNCHPANISQCLHGRVKTAAGVHWKFLE